MRGLVPRLLLAIVAVGIGVYFSRDVWGRYRQERRDADSARSDMRLAEARKADLQREKAQLESKTGRERLLREHGWLKPGEKPL